MNLPLFIAKRLFGERKETSMVSRPAVFVAVSGLSVGLAVMIVSICVVLGFKREIREKIYALGAHMEIVNRERTRSLESRPVEISDSLLSWLSSRDQISRVQPYIIKAAVLKTDETFRGIALKGVGSSYDLEFVRRHLKEGVCPQFSDSVPSNRIVISDDLAKSLGIALGDRVFTYFVGGSMRLRRLEVAGIYCTHLAEFDSNIAFVDMALTRKLCSFGASQYTGVEIFLKDYANAQRLYEEMAPVIDRIEDDHNNVLHLQTIEMAYPSLFGWLSLLDVNVWVILFLMVLVSGFMMVSGLLIIILERANMIGVLKALGSPDGMIRNVFLHLAVLFLLRGIVIGNIIGVGLCMIQKYFHLVELDASTYYVDYVPVDVDLVPLLLLNVATLAVTVLVLVLPSHLVSHIDPSKSIRFE